MATGVNNFDYESFCSYYTNIKNAVGALEDLDASTIGGVINSANNALVEDLQYAEVSSWASSKIEAWNNMLPGLKAAFQNCINLLDAAKQDAEDYKAFEEANQGISQ